MKSSIVAAAVLIVLVIAGALLIKPSFEDQRVVFVEAPLYKNTQLQLVPGETYAYVFTMKGTGNSTTANATYAIGWGDNCTLIRMMESVEFSGTCLDSNGNDERGYNTSLESPSVLLFQPWMLALREGWSWNSTMYISFDGKLRKVGENHYRVVRLDDYNGRRAFLVELRSGDGAAEYEWVDEQKRVLLGMSGDGYEVRLVNGTGIGGVAGPAGN
jgi:hypothetical protein